MKMLNKLKEKIIKESYAEKRGKGESDEINELYNKLKDKEYKIKQLSHTIDNYKEFFRRHIGHTIEDFDFIEIGDIWAYTPDEFTKIKTKELVMDNLDDIANSLIDCKKSFVLGGEEHELSIPVLKLSKK